MATAWMFSPRWYLAGVLRIAECRNMTEKAGDEQNRGASLVKPIPLVDWLVVGKENCCKKILSV
jgi:hypothetical protein